MKYYIILAIIGIINQLFNIKNIKSNCDLNNDIKKNKEKDYIIKKHKYLLLYNQFSAFISLLIFFILTFYNVGIAISGISFIIADYFLSKWFSKLNKLNIYYYIFNIFLLLIYGLVFL